MSKKNTSITIDTEVAENLDRYCQEKLIKKSALINKIIKEYLKELEVRGEF